jgi:hypothetical protein
MEATARRAPPSRARRELKLPITYKHKESNFRTLKRIAQRLERPIGDLLDEALEARFPEWREQISQLPPEDF